MAKKTTNSNVEGGTSLVDLLGKIDNGVEILSDSKSAVIKDYISTGNYILNAAMTGSLFKGVPAGRVLTLAGEPGCLEKNEKVEIYVVKTKPMSHTQIEEGNNVKLGWDVDGLTKEELISEMGITDGDYSDDELVEKFYKYCDDNKIKVEAQDLFENYADKLILIDTPDGYAMVSDLIKKLPREIYMVKTASHSIKCSCDHKIETPNGWVFTKDLKQGDRVLTRDGFQEITSIQYEKTEEVYDLTVVSENHRYWGGTGISSHNTGKTFLALSICREAQKKGYTPVYLDSEGSIDRDFVTRIGCDPNNFIIKQVGLVSEISTFVANLCAEEKKLPVDQRHKIILVLDSLGNLTSDKELQTTLDGGGAKDMTRNQQIKAFFRTNMTPIAQLGIPMIVNTHIYQTQDVFSKQVVSGGCVVPGTKIFVKEGLIPIEDIKGGSYVLSHDGEYHEVVKTFEFEKPTYTFTFEDGKTIECSFDHKFLVADGDDTIWVCAKNLLVNDEILTNDSKSLKIVQKVESSSSKKVHDICVDGTHSYVSEGGIINHNSGINYNSSLTVMLSVAKLEDKESDKAAENKVGEFTKTGVLVTATPKKSRFTIPQKVRFQIPFFKSPNPYTGLEAYVTWENSGIIRGKMIDEKEYSKLSDADKAQCYPMTDENGNPMYALRKDTSRNIVVEHLHGERPFPSLWTAEVFTDDVLRRLDETVIRPNFELPSQETNADVDELAALENI